MSPADRLIGTGGVLTFAFIGAVQALYGPLVPSFQRNFAIDAGTAGLVFTAHGSGSLCGILAPSIVRVNGLASHWLALATALLFIGATALSLAPTWPGLLAAAFVFALGFGIHVVRLNALFVAGFGRRGMAMSQLINAAFSVGTILGPVVLGVTADPSPHVFRTIAVLAVRPPRDAGVPRWTRRLCGRMASLDETEFGEFSEKRRGWRAPPPV